MLFFFFLKKSFGSFPDSLDEDVRFVYCAVAILAIVRVDPASVIDVDAAERFLKSCRVSGLFSFLVTQLLSDRISP